MKYYGITKISFEKQIESIYCGLIENNKISNFQSHDRNWFVSELKRGSVFYKLIRRGNIINVMILLVMTQVIIKYL